MVFLVHQYRATQEERDGHFHQTQVVVRNSQSDSGTLIQLLGLGLAWKNKATKNSTRIFRLCVVCLVHLLIFWVASLLASRIYSSKDAVLIRSDLCQNLARDSPTLSVTDFFSMKERTNARWALDYSRTCYNGDEKNNAQCNLLATSSLTKNQKFLTDQPCPFPDPNVCLDAATGKCPIPLSSTLYTFEIVKQAPIDAHRAHIFHTESHDYLIRTNLQCQGAVVVDSGKINTNRDLGLNSPQHQSIDYQRITTCAPLNTQDYSWIVSDDSSLVPGDEYRRYSYGQVNGSHDTFTFNQSAYARALADSAYTMR